MNASNAKGKKSAGEEPRKTASPEAGKEAKGSEEKTTRPSTPKEKLRPECVPVPVTPGETGGSRGYGEAQGSKEVTPTSKGTVYRTPTGEHSKEKEVEAEKDHLALVPWKKEAEETAPKGPPQSFGPLFTEEQLRAVEVLEQKSSLLTPNPRRLLETSRTYELEDGNSMEKEAVRPPVLEVARNPIPEAARPPKPKKVEDPRKDEGVRAWMEDMGWRLRQQEREKEEFLMMMMRRMELQREEMSRENQELRCVIEEMRRRDRRREELWEEERRMQEREVERRSLLAIQDGQEEERRQESEVQTFETPEEVEEEEDFDLFDIAPQEV